MCKPCISRGYVPTIKYKIFLYSIDILNCDKKRVFYRPKSYIAFHHSSMDPLLVKLFHRYNIVNASVQCDTLTVRL